MWKTVAVKNHFSVKRSTSVYDLDKTLDDVGVPTTKSDMTLCLVSMLVSSNVHMLKF